MFFFCGLTINPFRIYIQKIFKLVKFHVTNQQQKMMKLSLVGSGLIASNVFVRTIARILRYISRHLMGKMCRI
jgi:hypothetical protein